MYKPTKPTLRFGWADFDMGARLTGYAGFSSGTSAQAWYAFDRSAPDIPVHDEEEEYNDVYLSSNFAAA